MVKFFFVGVGKCGTSWIYAFCNRHSLIDVPSIKEPQLMDCEEFERARRISRFYAKTDAMGDFSNTYFFDTENPPKIKAYNPNAKIIITIRKPSERIISHFQFLRRNGLPASISLSAYLDAGDEVSIIKRSEYAEMINRYLDHFGFQNVLVLPMELLKSAPQVYADALCDFLETNRVKLTDIDTARVLGAAAPRNAFIARVAKAVAEMLRASGFLSVLSIFKNNKLVMRMLYSNNVGPIQTDFGSHADRIQKIDDDYPKLVRTYAASLSDQIIF